MHFMFDGEFAPNEIGRDLESLWQLLQEKGITSITDVRISLTGRGEDHERYQVRTDDGIISTMVFAPEEASGEEPPRYVPHTLTSIAKRPENLEVNAFSTIFGHDD